MTSREAPKRRSSSSFSISLPPDPESPRKARRFVLDALAASAWSPLAEEAVLLTSELVTNAVVHSASAAEVVLELEPDAATVRVTDADTGPLSPAAPSELGESGRGMVLVERMARAWGTEHRLGRKTVWFRLELEGAAPAPPLRRLASGGPFVPRQGGDALRLAERRLGSLVLRPGLGASMSAPEQVREILQRVVTALGASGAVLGARSTAKPPVEVGRREGTLHRRGLVLDRHEYGQLLVYCRRELGEDDEAFLTVAAERLAVMLAAESVPGVERARRASHELLSGATELLAGSSSSSHALSLAVQIVVPGLAEWCVAYGLDERLVARRVTAGHCDEGCLDAVSSFADHDLEVAAAVSRAIRTREPVLLASRADVAGQSHQVMVLPLAARDVPAGVLVLGAPEAPGPADYLATVELGRRVGLALENARLHEQVVAAADALQSSLLPRALPDLDHLQLGARYHSASPSLAVGGDFYDAFVVGDGSVVLAIGDVCGKGAAAAAVTRTSRDLLRVLLVDGWTLADSLRRLNRALLEDPGGDTFCTVAIARLEQGWDRRRLSLCLAGHPEPVLVRPSGSVELLGSPGLLLGAFPDERLELHETEVDLEAGATLVFYTDGVTEARRGQEMFGQEGLSALLGGLAGSEAQAVADAVEAAAARFSAESLRDDLAVLVARTTTGPSPTPRRAGGRP